MAIPGPSPSKLVEDSDTAAFSPQPSGYQQALDVEDVINFVEPLPNELQCPLCLEFLKEPTLTSCCGHHFCRECINHAITRSHVCPLCNDQGFQTLLNKEKQRLVNSLKVYCRRKSEGCEWVGELGRLEHHLDVEEGDCGCVEVECEFGPVGCVAKLPRKDLQRHKEVNVHKHLVLMSVMSLKSNEAFVKELREQRVELEDQLRQQQVEFQQQQVKFQQQLKKRDEEIQIIRVSLQQQLILSKELQDKLEEKQQKIAILEEQLCTKTKQLAQVEGKLAENAQQLVKVEDILQNTGQSLATVEMDMKKQSRANEKRLDDVETKQQEEKLEINRRLADVDKKVEEKGKELQEVRTQFQQDNNQMDEEMTGLRRRIQQVETSLAESQGQAKEVNEIAQKLQEQFVTFIPPTDFTMTDFEQHKKDDDDWFSPPFYSHIGGYKMCLRVNAKGRTRGKGTHVSIYVTMMCGEHDNHLKWPFRGDITVKVLNQRKEEKHVVETFECDDSISDKSSGRVIGRERSELGFGSSTFVAHSALDYNPAKNTEYLRDDCLKFRVTNVKLRNF